VLEIFGSDKTRDAVLSFRFIARDCVSV